MAKKTMNPTVGRDAIPAATDDEIKALRELLGNKKVQDAIVAGVAGTIEKAVQDIILESVIDKGLERLFQRIAESRAREAKPVVVMPSRFPTGRGR
jgi:hypothetical protein